MWHQSITFKCPILFPDGGGACVGPDCAERNCTWTGWGEWSSCSRSCGVGQQQRIRTFLSPGTNGSWCEDILGGNQEQRFCNIKPCRGQLQQLQGSPTIFVGSLEFCWTDTLGTRHSNKMKKKKSHFYVILLFDVDFGIQL